jgi:ADP-ribosylglycohydrolase
MPAISDYEKQVYAAVLGKTIGVYLGRPFEGWKKKDIEAKWGQIDRYVHEDQKVPLVVADDDLSGTFTFIRALEDSGLHARTPADFFGKMWLDYLIEGKTILWWGGLGLSTEHTAYLRLKQGVPSPKSGSIAVNAPAVAEQIGAQIFIDAFGMVAPGKPALAARLARRSASVSHDGEAVHAAVVVAAMVSAAFVEKKMEKVVAAGLAQIPKNSLIARMHRDIAGWVK